MRCAAHARPRRTGFYLRALLDGLAKGWPCHRRRRAGRWSRAPPFPATPRSGHGAAASTRTIPRRSSAPWRSASSQPAGPPPKLFLQGASTGARGSPRLLGSCSPPSPVASGARADRGRTRTTVRRRFGQRGAEVFLPQGEPAGSDAKAFESIRLSRSHRGPGGAHGRSGYSRRIIATCQQLQTPTHAVPPRAPGYLDLRFVTIPKLFKNGLQKSHAGSCTVVY